MSNLKEIVKQKIQKYLHAKKVKIQCYPLKSHYNSIIPLNIFQTWHTKNIPPLMFNAIASIKKNNPKFKHYLFNDDDCLQFIQTFYSGKVLEAYNKLVPGAYKADLWRCCVLYKYGGIYLDIKYKSVNGFKFITMTEKEHWVLDADGSGIYNALMVCMPNNQTLYKAINQIVYNVNHNYYGNSPLDPTGPRLLGKFFSNEEKNNFDMKHKVVGDLNNRFIVYNGYDVLRSYNGYLVEHNQTKKVPHYSQLWKERSIYS